jgi:D-3-phosphoglycerate dehydrogenase
VRLVDVDGVDVDVIPQGHLLLVRNDDTPGIVGHIGTLLGESRVNIARMAVGRKPGSGRAVMLIEVDNEAPAEVVAKVAAIGGVREARSIRLG